MFFTNDGEDIAIVNKTSLNSFSAIKISLARIKFRMRMLFSILLVMIASIRKIPYDIRKAYKRRQICSPLGASHVSRAIFTAVFRSCRVINTVFVAANCWNAWMVAMRLWNWSSCAMASVLVYRLKRALKATCVLSSSSFLAHSLSLYIRFSFPNICMPMHQGVSNISYSVQQCCENCVTKFSSQKM